LPLSWWVTDSGYVGRTSDISQQEVITDDFTGYGQSVSIPMPKAEESSPRARSD
jgi:hypothetical protein